MPVEENKTLIRLVFEETLNKGHLAIVDEVFSSQFVDHSTPEQLTGPRGVKAYFEQVRRGFPDIHVTIEDMIAESDKVVARTTWQGTHSEMYEGIKPTGKKVKRTMIQMFRVSDGKIQEEWNEGAGLLT
jgi:steroid delta-isomerase-like uncharacterized protein